MRKIFNIIPAIAGTIAGIGPAVTGTISQAKQQLHKQVVVPFLPTYEVGFIMYGVVPGQPVNKKESVYPFEKGASKEAEAFYQKMVASTNKYKVMPSEIYLKKRNKIVRNQHFGPVETVKAWNQAAVA